LEEIEMIKKTTITFTVLHRADQPLSPHLEGVLEETDDGNAVGQETGRQTVDVPDDAVRAELEALGNDGKFFGDGMLWIDFTDSSEGNGGARWGNASDEQIDAVLAYAERVLGSPQTIV
jgi:hypothetical protein